MFRRIVIIAFCALTIYVASAHKPHLGEKCSISDDECQLLKYRNLVQEATENGLPDIGIPKLDPYLYHNMNISVLDLVRILSPELSLTGIKTCNGDRYHTDIEKQVTTFIYICERISIEGDYSVQTTPMFKLLVGDINLHGQGKAKLDIEKLQINFKVPFLIKKLEDCELHFILDGDKETHTYQISEKVTLNIDSIHVGSQEISSVLVRIFNENWPMLSKFVAKPVIDVGVQIFIEFANKFFSVIPIKDLIIEDLSAYKSQ